MWEGLWEGELELHGWSSDTLTRMLVIGDARLPVDEPQLVSSLMKAQDMVRELHNVAVGRTVVYPRDNHIISHSAALLFHMASVWGAVLVTLGMSVVCVSVVYWVSL